MNLDLERTPVLIGAAQHTNRIQEPSHAPDPFELLEQVAVGAAEDAGDRKLLSRLSHVWTVNSSSVPHADLANELARRIDAKSADLRTSGIGGALPQWMVNRAAELIAAGERPVCLIAGAEALATKLRAKKAGFHLQWAKTKGHTNFWPPMEDRLGLHPVEIAHGLSPPTHMYALLETAVRHAEKLDSESHRKRMARLMDRFNAVACRNPHSWFSTRRGADELVNVSDENRWICYPYPKYLNAIIRVDMAAAVLMTDAKTAREAGLGPADVAYLSGWADAHDLMCVSERPRLEYSPAAAECGRAASEMARLGLDEITDFDIYCCFPSAVQIIAKNLGLAIDEERPITLTGGLPYHGGPGNNYVTHVLANALTHVREREDARVLVHGISYYATKHVVGIYTSRPPAAVPLPREPLQPRVDAAAAALLVDPSVEGSGHIVAYTVPFDGNRERQSGIALVEVDGKRTVAIADDSLSASLIETDGVGQAVRVKAGAERNQVYPA